MDWLQSLTSMIFLAGPRAGAATGAAGTVSFGRAGSGETGEAASAVGVTGASSRV